MNKNKDFFKSFKQNKYLEMLPDIQEEKMQIFITTVLTFISLSFFGFFAISPTLSTITELKKELSDNQFVNEQLEKKITNLSVLQQKYSLLEKDLPIVLSATPQNHNAPLLIGQIEAIALNTGTTIKKINVFEIEISKTKVPKKYSSFAFLVEVQGTSKQIMNFLSNLVDYERIVTIDSLTENKSRETNNLSQLLIKGRVYFKD